MLYLYVSRSSAGPLAFPDLCCAALTTDREFVWTVVVAGSWSRGSEQPGNGDHRCRCPVPSCPVLSRLVCCVCVCVHFCFYISALSLSLSLSDVRCSQVQHRGVIPRKLPAVKQVTGDLECWSAGAAWCTYSISPYSLSFLALIIGLIGL